MSEPNTEKYMKKQTQYRQGDVFIETIEAIPDGATKQTRQRIVLAHGEVTGHAHTVEPAESADWWKQGEDQFISVKSSATVSHQEHGALLLPKGNYHVVRQREYSPKEIRSVAD